MDFYGESEFVEVNLPSSDLKPKHSQIEPAINWSIFSISWDWRYSCKA